MSTLKNEKFGIEINYKISESGNVHCDIKESKRSKKLKYKYAKNLDEVKNYFDALVRYEEQRVIRMKERKQAREKEKNKAMQQMQVGTILVSSWGYEQTNVDFYKIVSKKGSSIELVEIASNQVEATGPMSARVTAGSSEISGERLKRRITGNSIKIHESSQASIWDGKPKYKSWYY